MYIARILNTYIYTIYVAAAYRGTYVYKFDMKKVGEPKAENNNFNKNC